MVFLGLSLLQIFVLLISLSTLPPETERGASERFLQWWGVCKYVVLLSTVFLIYGIIRFFSTMAYLAEIKFVDAWRSDYCEGRLWLNLGTVDGEGRPIFGYNSTAALDEAVKVCGGVGADEADLSETGRCQHLDGA